MNVFISWSGERSREVGELLDEWLQCVLQAVEPWMSSKDIDRGSLWFSEITGQLRDTSVGIICLTTENINKPWILFEAGTLAKGLSSSRVCTLLIDLQATDIRDPLAQFNHTLPDRSGIWKLVKTLNSELGDKAQIKEKTLERVFDTYWPQFNEKFNNILNTIPQKNEIKKRSNDDVLLELLNITRRLENRFRYFEPLTFDRSIEVYPVDEVVLTENGLKEIILGFKSLDYTESAIIKRLVNQYKIKPNQAKVLVSRCFLEDNIKEELV